MRSSNVVITPVKQSLGQMTGRSRTTEASEVRDNRCARGKKLFINP